MTDFAKFITVHGDDDTDRLILSRDKWEGIDIPLAVNTILGRRKMRHKVPQWFSCNEIIYPSKLCVEQCSSEVTARLKMEMILQYAGASHSGGDGIRIADLTGGLGVDSFFFATVSEKVLYNEADPMLAEAAAHNFEALGLRNIETCNFLVGEDGRDGENGRLRGAGNEGGTAADCGASSSATVGEILGDFGPDVIYLDPARRSENRKVFLIEECKPDILALKESLLKAARFVAVKLSPMADITMVLNRLGRCCREISAISADGECKEIIVLMDREYEGECIISARTQGAVFQFLKREEEEAEATFVKNIVISDCGESGQEDSGTELSEGKILLEPDKALMKTAPFKLLCSRFGIAKLGVSTHYYLAPLAGQLLLSREDSKEDYQLPVRKVASDGALFRSFRILKVLPFDKRGIKAVRQEYPDASVTARNFPLDSAALRKKLAVGESDLIHIFGLKVLERNCLIVTERILFTSF